MRRHSARTSATDDDLLFGFRIAVIAALASLAIGAVLGFVLALVTGADVCKGAASSSVVDHPGAQPRVTDTSEWDCEEDR